MNQRIRHRLWLLVCMLSVVIVFPRQVYADKNCDILYILEIEPEDYNK